MSQYEEIKGKLTEAQTVAAETIALIEQATEMIYTANSNLSAAVDQLEPIMQQLESFGDTNATPVRIAWEKADQARMATNETVPQLEPVKAQIQQAIHEIEESSTHISSVSGLVIT